MMHPLFRFWTEQDLEELPPVEWLVDGVLPKRGLCVLYGPSGAGKSFVALSLAVSIARGRPWLRLGTQRGRVVYIAAEGAYGLAPRLTALKQSYGISSVKLLTVVPDTVHLHNEEILGAYLTQLRQHVQGPIALTVIDTLSRCSSGSDESSNAQRELTVDGLNEIRRVTEGAVLPVHHTGWKEDHMRGGSALQAAADCILALKKPTARLELKIEKQRDTEDGAVIHMDLTRSAESLVITRGERPTVALTKQQRAALHALIKIGVGSGVSTTGWRKSTELPSSSFFAARKRLVDDGYVSVLPGKLNGTTPAGLALLQLQPNSKQLQTGVPSYSTPPPSWGGWRWSRGTRRRPYYGHDTRELSPSPGLQEAQLNDCQADTRASAKKVRCPQTLRSTSPKRESGCCLGT